MRANKPVIEAKPSSATAPANFVSHDPPLPPFAPARIFHRRCVLSGGLPRIRGNILVAALSPRRPLRPRSPPALRGIAGPQKRRAVPSTSYGQVDAP